MIPLCFLPASGVHSVPYIFSAMASCLAPLSFHSSLSSYLQQCGWTKKSWKKAQLSRLANKVAKLLFSQARVEAQANRYTLFDLT